jgi:hypothetical protein
LPFGSTKNGAGTSFLIHGAPTYENIRVPLWLGFETGRRDLHRAQNALIKIGR